MSSGEVRVESVSTRNPVGADAGGAGTGAATGPGDPARPVASRALSFYLERWGAVAVMVALFVIFSLLKPQTFPTWQNITTLLSTQAILAILAIGLLVPLAAGEFDLSIGYTLGFTAMVAAVLTGQHGVPVPLAVVISILAGALVGVVNGLAVVKVRINAFIATLGAGTVLSGLTIWISHGNVVYQGIPQSLLSIGRTQIVRLPLTVFYTFALVLIFVYFLEHTPTGRYIHAIGVGRETVRLAGIATDRLRIAAFVISGGMAGVAGVLQTATVGSAHPDTGPDFLLPAFAAAFLGATTIKPGRFNVLGTVVALFLLAIGIAGLQQLGAPFWVSPVFNGGALLVAVGLAAVRRVRSSRE
jgi:ribose transport system permease protein